jgi:hypothetical protein
MCIHSPANAATRSTAAGPGISTETEADVSSGLPIPVLVRLPKAAVRDSIHRSESAKQFNPGGFLLFDNIPRCTIQSR